MQFFGKIALFSVGMATCFSLRRLNFYTIYFFARRFWRLLFFSQSKLTIPVLQFLNLGWSLIPWITFFTIYTLQKNENAFLFLFGVIGIGVLRLFNHNNWLTNAQSSQLWLREQGILKEYYSPQFIALQSPKNLTPIVERMCKNFAANLSATNEFDMRGLGLVIVLGSTVLFANPKVKIENSLLSLWFLTGYSLFYYYRLERLFLTKKIIHLCFFLCCVILFPKNAQCFLLIFVSFTAITAGTWRDGFIDLAWEMRPKSERRVSGELQLLDSHKLTKLMAVRDFGDVVVLGRPYRFLFALRDIASSSRARGVLIKLDILLASWGLLLFVFQRFLKN